VFVQKGVECSSAALQQAVSDSDWASLGGKSAQVKESLTDASFWAKLNHSISFLKPFSDFIHQIEADCPSLGRSYAGIMDLEKHLRAATRRWQSDLLLVADADTALNTWECRREGCNSRTPVLQAAHVAANPLDPTHADVDKTCVAPPEVPEARPWHATAYQVHQ
jgi:hypothetical protein